MNKFFFFAVILLLTPVLYGWAQEKNEWNIRVRGLAIVPSESATIGVIGGDASIGNAIIPEVDITYYFAKNFSAELILGTSRHSVKATGSNLSAIGGPEKASVDLGKVWLLPPTLTVQYHLPTGTAFKPYAGAGINYTIFYGVDEGDVVRDVNYKNSVGFATQIGFDFDISDRVFVNVDAKKVFLSSDVTVDASNLTPSSAPELAPVLAGIPADVKIDPWIFGIGVGYRIK